MSSGFLIRLIAVAASVLMAVLLVQEEAYLNRGYTIEVAWRELPKLRPKNAPTPTPPPQVLLKFPAWRKAVPLVLGIAVFISLVLLVFRPGLSFLILLVPSLAAWFVWRNDVAVYGYNAAPMSVSTLLLMGLLVFVVGYFSQLKRG
ncbi:MAG: hypothetical protein WBX25_06975 [Rhodomicrobium sp.]